MSRIKLILTFLLIVLSLSVGNRCFAGLRGAEMAFHVGYSNPLGGFGKQGLPNDGLNLTGFNGARPGVSYGLDLNFYAINDYVGILILFTGHSYGFSPNAYTGLAPSNPLSRHTWTQNSEDRFSQFNAMGGVSFRYPLLSFLMLTAKLGIGYSHLLTPYYLMEAMDARQTVYTRELSSCSASAFGYNAGLGFKFILSDAFHLNLRVDYFGSTPFKLKELSSELNMKKPSDESKVNMERNTNLGLRQMYNAVNVSFGFSIGF